MAYEEILYEVSDRIATITLNRPEKLNAWTGQMGKEVRAATGAADADPGVRVILVNRRRERILLRRGYVASGGDHGLRRAAG